MSKVQYHWFDQVLLPQGWTRNVRVGVFGGRYTSVEPSARAEASDIRHTLALPGLPNMHSHAFQHAMAGMAEVRSAGRDDFWSWRESMYRLANRVDPDDLQAIAAGVFARMLESGFTRVGEFHYLHHDVDGKPYARGAEMSERIIAAAQSVGIGLTLLPVLYRYGGFERAEPAAHQRRFVSAIDPYLRLIDDLRSHSRDGSFQLGIAPHSLRAVDIGDLRAILAAAPDGPVHIHVAEQQGEVDDCVAWSGMRPVQWLLNHFEVDARWCLVHATHIDATEVRGIAASNAVVGACPITEANLGDGILPAADLLAGGVRIGIGTDSNVQIDAAAELRMLEYSQRLAQRRRNVLATASQPDTTTQLLNSAYSASDCALGIGTSEISPNAAADFVTLGRASDQCDVQAASQRVASWVFADERCIDQVWVGGRQRVANGSHVDSESVSLSCARRVRRLRT